MTIKDDAYSFQYFFALPCSLWLSYLMANYGQTIMDDLQLKQDWNRRKDQKLQSEKPKITDYALRCEQSTLPWREKTISPIKLINIKNGSSYDCILYIQEATSSATSHIKHLYKCINNLPCRFLPIACTPVPSPSPPLKVSMWKGD